MPLSTAPKGTASAQRTVFRGCRPAKPTARDLGDQDISRLEPTRELSKRSRPTPPRPAAIAIITCALGLILTQRRLRAPFPHQASGDAGRWAAPSPTLGIFSARTQRRTRPIPAPVGTFGVDRNSGNESAYIAGVEPGSVRTRAHVRSVVDRGPRPPSAAARAVPGRRANTTVVTYTGQTAAHPRTQIRTTTRTAPLRTGGLDVGAPPRPRRAPAGSTTARRA